MENAIMSDHCTYSRVPFEEKVSMGHIALEEYYAQICLIFSKFEQSVLGNG